MPARKITINGVSNLFRWQVGNTKRFIKFNTVTDVEYKEYCSMFDVYCGQNIVSVPNELREQFKAKYEEWKKTKMKKYKVGDTIYLKGVVERISKYDTRQPYAVNLGYMRPIIWPHADDVVELSKPVKPVLPKEVADEISFAKSIKGVTFDDYIVRELIRSDYKDSATNKMIQSSDIPNAIEVLSNAWYNGYTAEKEPTWYIEVPGKFNRPTYYAINNGALAFGYLDEDKKWYRDYSAHAFTDEEIKKYDLENFKKELVTDDDED